MKRIILEATGIFIISCLLSVLLNVSRSGGIPLIPKIQEVEKEGKILKIPSFIASEADTLVRDITFHAPQEIDTQTAYRMFLSGKVLFMDTRDREEYLQGHISGAVHVPFNDLASAAAYIRSLERDTTIVTYCDGEECNLSMEMAYQLYELGFGDVYYFFGGWDKWLKSGYPVDKGD